MNFNETDFLGKVSNTFIMILMAIMTDDVKRVEHKVSPSVKEKLLQKTEELNKKNLRQMYDEPNVKNITILSKEEKEDHYEVKVVLTSRYMDYQVNKDTGKYVSGINDERVQKDHYLTFSKIKDAKEQGIAKKCPSCGASIDSNNTGVCPYCGSIYNLKDYDWILTELN